MRVLELNIRMFEAKEIKFIELQAKEPFIKVIASFSEEEWNNVDFDKMDNEMNKLMFRKVRLFRIKPDQIVEVLLYNIED